MVKLNPVMDDAEEKSEAKSDPLHEMREQFKMAEDYWNDERSAALDDIKFRSGEQWPETIKTNRERDKRPCLTVDKLNQYVRQIVNDGRQNRPSIKVRPVDSGADVPTAEVFQGIVRHIEDSSNADAAYDTALDNAATCGFGYFRVLSEYAGDETFDQELQIKRVRNPLSVMVDPSSQEADGSDMKFAFVVEDMSCDEFEVQFPGKDETSFETSDNASDWYGEDTIRVAEWWYVKEEARTLYLMEDGSVISQSRYDELKEGGMLELDSFVQEKRNIPVRKVYHCKVSGKEFLTEPQEWLGRWIPIFPVWGNELDVEGKVFHSGIIRPAKDAQRLYNYSRSAFAERVALTPKAPWVAAAGQVEDFEDEWNTANTDNHSVLRYNPTSLNGTPVPPPQRVSATDIPSGFAQDMQISEHDIQGAIGMYNSSLGAPSNERSGKAIMARQREGDTGTFHYHDNLNRAIRHCGRVLVDLIPKIYDSNRVVRILGYDGSVDSAELDPTQMTASQKIGTKMIYNLGVGKYDVSISTGPSYNTLREEKTAAMTEMVQAAPQLMGVIGDLLVKNMDWPGADEIAERLQLTLAPNVQQAIQAKKQNNEPPEMTQMKAQYEQVMGQMNQALQQAMQQIQQLEQEVQSKQSEIAINEQKVRMDAAKIQIEEYKAQTERIALEIQAANNPDETAMLERLKLEYEDKWKVLEAEKDVIVAQIQAEAKVRDDMEDSVEEPESEGPDSNTALAAAIQGFQEALMTMRAPKVATMPDGRQIRVE